MGKTQIFLLINKFLKNHIYKKGAAPQFKSKENFRKKSTIEKIEKLNNKYVFLKIKMNI